MVYFIFILFLLNNLLNFFEWKKYKMEPIENICVDKIRNDIKRILDNFYLILTSRVMV